MSNKTPSAPFPSTAQRFCTPVECSQVDRLSYEMFVTARRGIACVRLLPTVDITICGRMGNGPAEFTDKSSRHYVSQHCTGCDKEYRAAHDGRTPITD